MFTGLCRQPSTGYTTVNIHRMEFLSGSTIIKNARWKWCLTEAGKEQRCFSTKLKKSSLKKKINTAYFPVESLKWWVFLGKRWTLFFLTLTLLVHTKQSNKDTFGKSDLLLESKTVEDIHVKPAASALRDFSYNPITLQLDRHWPWNTGLIL